MKKSNHRPVAFVAVSTNHGTMLVNRHDYKLTPDGGGIGVGYQVFNNSSCEQGEVDSALLFLMSRRQNFGDGVVAIDCGANIGTHTIEWAQCMHGWGQVIAIEAQERIFYALAGNITLNNCFNARAVWAAVGARKGQMQVPQPDYHLPSSFGSLEIIKRGTHEFIGQDIDYSDQATLTTQVMAIDDLGLERLDFVKIDIEGMEMDALKGARSSLVRFKPQLLIERIKSDEGKIRKVLEKLRYKVLPFGINLLAIHLSDPAAALVGS